jgi:hypothetical protein
MRAASSLVGIIAKKVLFSHLSPIAISENCIAPPRCVPMCGRHIALYSPKPASRHLTISQNVLPLVTTIAVVDVVNPARGLPLAMTASNALRSSTRLGAVSGTARCRP